MAVHVKKMMPAMRMMPCRAMKFLTSVHGSRGSSSKARNRDALGMCGWAKPKAKPGGKDACRVKTRAHNGRQRAAVAKQDAERAH
jgi:hypothetical protein